MDKVPGVTYIPLKDTDPSIVTIDGKQVVAREFVLSNITRKDVSRGIGIMVAQAMLNGVGSLHLTFRGPSIEEAIIRKHAYMGAFSITGLNAAGEPVNVSSTGVPEVTKWYEPGDDVPILVFDR